MLLVCKHAHPPTNLTPMDHHYRSHDRGNPHNNNMNNNNNRFFLDNGGGGMNSSSKDGPMGGVGGMTIMTPGSINMTPASINMGGFDSSGFEEAANSFMVSPAVAISRRGNSKR